MKLITMNKELKITVRADNTVKISIIDHVEKRVKFIVVDGASLIHSFRAAEEQLKLQSLPGAMRAGVIQPPSQD